MFVHTTLASIAAKAAIADAVMQIVGGTLIVLRLPWVVAKSVAARQDALVDTLTASPLSRFVAVGPAYVA